MKFGEITLFSKADKATIGLIVEPGEYKPDIVLLINGFKFFYELLSVSNGSLRIGEVALTFQPRIHGKSKLDLSILWESFKKIR